MLRGLGLGVEVRAFMFGSRFFLHLEGSGSAIVGTGGDGVVESVVLSGYEESPGRLED